MGHSRDDKARNHERIVAIASARMRESGTEAPSVAELMQSAGLTHGGFYKHFDSRDQLVAEAVTHSFAESERAVAEVTADQADPLGAFVDWYLSSEHRANPGTGCGIVALGSDAARSGDAVQTAYREQVERYLVHLEELLGNSDNAAAALSQLVGAMHVARAIGPGALSDRILEEARQSVKALSRPA